MSRFKRKTRLLAILFACAVALIFLYLFRAAISDQIKEKIDSRFRLYATAALKWGVESNLCEQIETENA